MTDLLPYPVAAVLVAASAALCAAIIVLRQTWHCWRSPFRPEMPQASCFAIPSLADVVPAAKPEGVARQSGWMIGGDQDGDLAALGLMIVALDCRWQAASSAVGQSASSRAGSGIGAGSGADA